MKYNFKNIIAFAVLLAVVALSGVTASGKDSSWKNGESRRRADYIFMEAMRRNALEEPDSYFELIDRVNRLVPEDNSIDQELGYYYMVMSENDSTIFAKGYELVKNGYYSNPDDYYAGLFYGTINDRLRRRDESVKVWTMLDSVYPSKVEITMKLAEALCAANDSSSLRRAIEVLDRIEVAEGKSLAVTSPKIRAMFALGDTTDIYCELNSLLTATPRSADNRVYAGDLFMALGKPDSAIVYYNNACEVDSTSGLAYYKRAEYYKSIGDSVASDREVFHALEMNNLDLEVKLGILTGYIRELYTDPLQQPRIKELFARLLDNHPHEPAIHEVYCSYLVAIGDYAGAAEQQSYVVDSDPSVEDSWSGLQSLYMQAQDYEGGVDAGERALHYFPENGTLYLMTALCYSQLDKPDKAIEYLDKSLAQADDNNAGFKSQVLSVKGDVYYKAEQTDSAFYYYERALELNPLNYSALNNCAYYLACEGRDLDRAEQMSARTLQEDPDNPVSLDTYAWVMFKRADYQKAKEYIDKVIVIDDEPSAEVYQHAGDIYFMAGDPDGALIYWEKALEMDPDNELLKRKVRYKTYFYK